jgi:hypothetical protein
LRAAPEYAEIFERRAASYHAAMAKYPRARRREFEAVVELLDIAAGQLLVDAPAGGGYLRRFVAHGAEIIGVDPCLDFTRAARAAGERALTSAIDHLPLSAEPRRPASRA